MAVFEEDTCIDHPDNGDPACIWCRVFAVGLTGDEAHAAAQQAWAMSARQRWVETTRPADPERTIWVKLWTEEGACFFAWWGTDREHAPIREIRGMDTPFPATVFEDARCDAIEFARLAFRDPAEAARLYNQLETAAAARIGRELHVATDRRDTSNLEEIVPVANRAGALGLEVDELPSTRHLDYLAEMLEVWEPWVEVKQLPEIHPRLFYSTLIDRLSPLTPAEALAWVPTVGVDAATAWWFAGATPDQAAAALEEVAQNTNAMELLDPEVNAFLADTEQADPALAAHIGPRLRGSALQQARGVLADPRRTQQVAVNGGGHDGVPAGQALPPPPVRLRFARQRLSTSAGRQAGWPDSRSASITSLISVTSTGCTERIRIGGAVAGGWEMTISGGGPPGPTRVAGWPLVGMFGLDNNPLVERRSDSVRPPGLSLTAPSALLRQSTARGHAPGSFRVAPTGGATIRGPVLPTEPRHVPSPWGDKRSVMLR